MPTGLLEAPGSQDTQEKLQKLAKNLCRKLEVSEKIKLRKGLISTENQISPQINAWVETVAKKNGLKPKDYRAFKRAILDTVEEEYEQERLKNEQSKLPILQEETKSKIRELLVRKGKGEMVTDRENAEAIVEQLKGDEMVKVRVFEYLRAQYEKNYTLPKNSWDVNEEQETKAKQVVKRLLILNEGRVAKQVYKKLKEGEPDTYESVEKKQKRILKELGLEKAFTTAEQALEPGFKAKGEFNRKLEEAYQLIDVPNATSDNTNREQKIRKIEKLAKEAKTAMYKIADELPKIRKSIDDVGREINKKSPEKFNDEQQFILNNFEHLHEHLRTLPKPSYGTLRSIEQQYEELEREVLALRPLAGKVEKANDNYAHVEQAIKNFRDTFEKIRAEEGTLAMEYSSAFNPHKIEDKQKVLEAQKEDLIRNLLGYLKNAESAYKKQGPDFKKRLSLGYSLIALQKYTDTYVKKDLKDVKKVCKSLLQKIRKDNEELGSATNPSKKRAKAA